MNTGLRPLLLAAALSLGIAAPALVSTSMAAAAPTAAPVLSNYVQKKSSRLIPVASGSQVRATITCPVGTNAVGGGAYLEGNSAAQGLNTSNPDFDGRTWVVRVNNSDESQFAQFRVYAICVAGIRNYQRIEGIGVDNPGGTQATAEAFCPAGTVPLGGGVNLTSPQLSSYINSSRPIANGWRATAANANPADDNFVMPYAICGDKPASYQRIAGTPSTLKSGVQGQAAAGCPAGTTVLSGGGQSSSTSQSVGQNSSAPSSKRIWQVFENNLSNVSTTLTAYAVCATTTS